MTDNTMSAEFREEGATAPPTVSVVIPVYNTQEQYHRECFDSVLAQTFTDFELLLVDDGSTDGSSVLCDEYAAKDSRVRVIHQENKGLAAALNAGLDAARGAFCAFVDHDDCLDKTYIEKLHEGIEREKTDVFVCGMHCMDVGMSSILYTLTVCPKRQSARKVLQSFKSVAVRHASYGSCLLRRHFLSAHNIRFALETRTFYTVDNLFFWTLCFEIAAEDGDIAATDVPLYFFREHAASMSHNTEHFLNYFDSNCIFVELLGERYHYRYLLHYLTVPFSWYIGAPKEHEAVIRERFILLIKRLQHKSKNKSLLMVLLLTFIMPRGFLAFILRIYQQLRG